MVEKTESKTHRTVFIGLMLIGFLIMMESFIFIYITVKRWFTHISILVFILTFIIGLLMFIESLHYKNKFGIKEKDGEMAPYLKKINRYMPLNNPLISGILGIMIITFSLTHYLFGLGSERMGEGDLTLFMFGGFLIIYPYIPQSYSIERDFILTFLGFLAVFMAVLPFLFDAGDESFKYYFLTYPVHKLLLIIGIENTLIPPSRITFVYDGKLNVVIIARACSGIDSFSIFSASFIAFVLVVYRKIDLQAIIFMTLGILLAYVGNVIRMTIVIASGYYYGPQTMSFVHANIGYLIFFVWMGLFWFLLYKYLMKNKDTIEEQPQKE